MSGADVPWYVFVLCLLLVVSVYQLARGENVLFYGLLGAFQLLVLVGYGVNRAAAGTDSAQ